MYPNNLTVGLDYNAQGYLTREYNAASDYVYRTVTHMDAFGNISGATISDDILTGTYLHSQKTGQMLSSVVELGTSAVHELNYEDYDEFGNIKTQSNLITGTSETFVYDDLQRLTSNEAMYNGATIQSVTYDYDAVGNFNYKSDYSTTASNAYQYGQNGAGPNAVSTVIKPGSTVNFAYDNKGNMTSGDNLVATYTAYGKPYSLTKNSVNSTFAYGSDRMRYKQQKGSDTTYYIDKLFEVEGNDWRAYISDVAVIKHNTSSNFSDTHIRYLHRDRLGSAETHTDHNGQLTERRRFDPFGKPRGINSESLLLPRLSSFATDGDSDSDITRRGFTDHEHLDEQELIHMNGRVYDYNLGRFMSVDPFIQSPTNSQSVNPYSYIMNNPLAGTDPTGYCAAATGTRIKSCGDMKVEVKVTMKDGSTATKSSVVKDVNFKNGADTSSAMSKGAAQAGGQFTAADFNSQSAIAKQSPTQSSGAGNSQSFTASQTTDQVGKPISSFGSGSATIKEQARAGIGEAAESVGMSNLNYGGVSAKLKNVERDDSGIINRATVSCNLSCKKEAGDQTFSNQDILRGHMIRQMRSTQQVAVVVGGIAVGGVASQAYLGLSLSAKTKAEILFTLSTMLGSNGVDSLELRGRNNRTEIEQRGEVGNKDKVRKRRKIKIGRFSLILP